VRRPAPGVVVEAPGAGDRIMQSTAHVRSERAVPGETPAPEGLALVFERTSDAVVIVDDAGVYRHANPAANRLFGVPDLVGRHVREFLGGGDGPGFDQTWRSFRARGTQRGERLLVRPDGSVRIVAFDATAHVIPHRHLSIIRDVTESRRRERVWAAKLAAVEERRREAERLRAESAAAQRAKDRFLAMLSHELRNAAATVLAGVRVLRSRSVTAEQRDRTLAAISRSGELEMRLVEDLLELGRIEAGKMTVDLASIDVLGVVREALDAVRPEATARGVDLRLAIRCERAPARADAARLRQVFVNLLVNGVKFTPDGGRVVVTVDASSAVVTVSVSDTGSGIRPDVLPRLFEPFVQSADTVRGSMGFGLGLAIVKHIVEAHQGTVRAISSGEGQGATFVVTLPIDIGGSERRSPR
jgi:hypothetical protein